MAQKSKWLEGSSPGDTVTSAARHALEARLELVWHYMPLAADAWQSDADAVHQLRVSTRRAEAVMRSYRELLPARRAKWFDRRLKQVRQVAGVARDADVMLARLSGLLESRADPAWKALLKRLRSQRREAQGPIEALHRKLARKDFPGRARQLVKRTRWRGSDRQQDEPSFGEAARMVLRDAMSEFLAAGGGDLSDIGALHQFRIRGKRLRYALELMAAAFDSRLRSDVYPQVEQVQERLGQINDHATAIQRFRGWLEEWQDPLLAGPLTELSSGEEAALAASREEFFKWWTPERMADLRRRCEDLLATPVVERVA